LDQQRTSAPQSSEGSRDSRPRQERRPRRRGGPRRRRKVCAFCVDKIDAVDYKDVSLLGRYIANSGRILSRRRTGTCAKHQRMLATAIKRARHVALLPYTSDHTRRFG